MSVVDWDKTSRSTFAAHMHKARPWPDQFGQFGSVFRCSCLPCVRWILLELVFHGFSSSSQVQEISSRRWWRVLQRDVGYDTHTRFYRVSRVMSQLFAFLPRTSGQPEPLLGSGFPTQPEQVRQRWTLRREASCEGSAMVRWPWKATRWLEDSSHRENDIKGH